MPTISLPQVLQVAISRALSEVHTCLPGRVEKYDHKKQRASVQPMIKKKYRDGEVASLPVIVDVPVVFPRTALGSFTFPVNPGDYVMLTFSERAMEKFLSLGSNQEPGDTRKFDLTDAIAVPGLYPFSEPSLTENNEDSLWVFKKNKIRLKGDGDLEIEVEKDLKVTVKGKATIIIQGDANVEITGNVTGTVGGDLTADITGKATITAADMDITAGLVNITGDLDVSGMVNLGGGGPGIAREGDSVEVTVTGGSSAGTYSGTITSSSSNSTTS